MYRYYSITTVTVVLLTVLYGSIIAQGVMMGSIAEDEEPRRIVKMAFMHRHGARTGPIVQPDGQLNFKKAVLTDIGVRMASALGVFLRRHYSNVTAMNERLPYTSNYTLFCNDVYSGPLPCVGDAYDPRVVVSETTAFERTLRTGVGVARGMFMKLNSTIGDFAASPLVVPYLPAVPAPLDLKLGFYYSWPTAILHTPGPINAYNADHNNETLSFINQTDVERMGLALFAGTSHAEQCATAQTLCVLAAQDIVSCAYSNGPISAINDTLVSLWPLYMEALEFSNSFLYMFWGNSSVNRHDIEQGDTALVGSTSDADRQEDYWANVGPYGRLYAQATIADFRATLAALRSNGSSQGPVPLVVQSSAHDVTIYGYLVAIGAIHIANYLSYPLEPHRTTIFDPISPSAYLLVPRFASIVVLELYSDGNISVGMATGPQRYYGNTSLGEEYKVTEHYSQYKWGANRSVLLGCTDETGKVTYAPECSIDDLARTVDSMSPRKALTRQHDPNAKRSALTSHTVSSDEYSPSGVMSSADRLFLPDRPIDGATDYSYCYRLPEDEVTSQCQGDSESIPASTAGFAASLAKMASYHPSSLPVTHEMTALATQLLELHQFQKVNGGATGTTVQRVLGDIATTDVYRTLRDASEYTTDAHRVVNQVKDDMSSYFCFSYRQVCPQFACTAPHYVLNASNYGCVWVTLSSNDSGKDGRHGAWFYVGMAIGSLLLGGVVGLVMGVTTAERRERKDAMAEGLVAEEGCSGPLSINNAINNGKDVAPEREAGERAPLVAGGSGSTPPPSSSSLSPPSNTTLGSTLPIVDYAATPPMGLSRLGSQLQTAPTSPKK